MFLFSWTFCDKFLESIENVIRTALKKVWLMKIRFKLFFVAELNFFVTTQYYNLKKIIISRHKYYLFRVLHGLSYRHLEYFFMHSHRIIWTRGISFMFLFDAFLRFTIFFCIVPSISDLDFVVLYFVELKAKDFVGLFGCQIFRRHPFKFVVYLTPVSTHFTFCWHTNLKFLHIYIVFDVFWWYCHTFLV